MKKIKQHFLTLPGQYVNFFKAIKDVIGWVLAWLKTIWDFEKPISEVYQTKNNAFDIFRFGMASLVIVHHAYVLLGIPDTNLFVRFTGGQLNLGGFAVGNFFVISGFLVTQSLSNSKTLVGYFSKRFLRLFPALFISLALSAIFLGPFITGQSLPEYFLGVQGTSPFRFIFLNFTLNVFGYDYSIRDLFANNPYPYAVNGSLWTLKHEFASYVLLAVLSVFGMLKHPKLLLVFTAFVGGVYLAYDFVGTLLFGKITTTWWIFHSAEYPSFLLLLWLFLLGAILYIFRERIFVSTKMLVLLTGVLLLSIKLGYLNYTWHIFSPYLVICLSILLPLSWFSKYGDFSYGIYIYAFPVQQVLAMYYPHFGPKRMMLLAFLITLVISIFSWHFVEKPALSLKKKMGNI